MCKKLNELVAKNEALQREVEIRDLLLKCADLRINGLVRQNEGLKSRLPRYVTKNQVRIDPKGG